MDIVKFVVVLQQVRMMILVQTERRIGHIVTLHVIIFGHVIDAVHLFMQSKNILQHLRIIVLTVAHI
jgi:hypothetical protein